MRADDNDPAPDAVLRQPDAGEHAHVHTLRDGARLLVRSLQPGDRDEIADGYEQLSPESRRLRFFNAPDHLSERLLDYLTDVDGVDRVALVARAIDEPGTPGVGVARYARDLRDLTTAEAAVTVLDTHRNRGIATILLKSLVDEAVANGITTFTASVMWENKYLLDGLREYGAVVVPDEPGVAAVSVDLPHDARAFVGSPLHWMLHTVAARLGR
ncbi:MAG TPA: GNAT family N-acetyltransferase [Ilumatobacteraceae bacterium]|nr:GNAT family N-acetyltransferase [Ilumatobacteraceae bacterium]